MPRARSTFGGEATHTPIQEVSINGSTAYGPAPGVGVMPLFFDRSAQEPVTEFYLQDLNGGFTIQVAELETNQDGYPPIFQVAGELAALYDAAGHAFTSWEGVGSGADNSQPTWVYESDAGVWPNVPVDNGQPLHLVRSTSNPLPAYAATWSGMVFEYTAEAGPAPDPGEGEGPVTTAPGAPLTVTATAGAASATPTITVDLVDIPQNDGGKPLTGFRLGWGTWTSPLPYRPDQRDDGIVLTGFQPSTTYNEANGNGIRARWINEDGEGPWKYANSVTTAAAPTAPGPISAAAPMRPPIPTYGERTRAWYNLAWSNTAAAWNQTPPRTNEVRISFLQGDPPSIVGWGKEGSSAAYGAALQALRANGVRVIASLGGEDGHINLANRAGVINALKAFKNQIGVYDGFDIDLEGSAVPNGRGSDGKFHAVYIAEQLRAEFGGYFYVTMAPPGGSPVNAYLPVAKALYDTKTTVNGAQVPLLGTYGQQFYDNVTITNDAVLGRINESVGYGIPAAHTVLGMQSPSTGRLADAAYTWPDQAVVRLNYIKAKHAQIGGWYNWVMNASDRTEWDTKVGALVEGWE